MTSSLSRPAWRLAHLSDPHFTVPEWRHWREMLNKRVPGYLAWHRRRRHVHHRAILDALMQDISHQQPDHVALTGDLTQLGLAAECRQARHWLEQLAPESSVTMSVIPGNHDTYAPEPTAVPLSLWEPWMSDDPDSTRKAPDHPRLAGSRDNRAAFPWLRRRGRISLIGTSTALPTPWPMATGSLGSAQLERLAACLQHAGRRGDYRILLIHHVPCRGMIHWRKRLTDMAALQDVIRRYGVELVLHGHAHRPMQGWLETPTGHAPVIGAPSASLTPPKQAGYGLFDIAPHPRGWSTTVTYRTLSGHSGHWHFTTRGSARLPDVTAPITTAA
ncbi:metallophosphoesterase family protein [Kushneria sinocarnis]|nr:metallophosphoesterase [Kushneria sinocarnis]